VEEMRTARSLDPEAPEIAVELARLLIQDHNPRGALEPAMAATRLAPDLADAHWLAGQAHVLQSREKEAVPFLQKAWELDRDDRNYLISYLLALESLGRHQSALQLLTPEEGGVDPDSPYLFMRRGTLKERLGQPQEALGDFLSALERSPGFPGAADHILAISWRLGPSRQTASACQQALKFVPDRTDLRRELTRILVLLNRQEDAIPSLERLLIDAPNDPTIPMQLGVIRYGQEKLREAIRLFRRAQKLNPDLTDLRNWLWRALNRADSLEAALNLADEMAQAAPKDPRAGWYQANSLVRLGRPREALKALERVQELQPDNREARLLSAILLYDEGDTTGARTQLKAVLETYPDDRETLFRLGVLEERQGNTEEALRWFRRLIRLHPDDALALNYAGYMCADAGIELETARQWIERAVALDEGNGAYIDSYGWVLYRLERFEEAVEQLERAEKLLPEEEEILLHLAYAYRAVGRTDSAIEVLRRVLDLNPQSRKAKELLRLWERGDLETGNPR
jgi:tetratricopeptide (TPR) repeat protein